MGYLGACDIVLNLRYPTVGESSGTLLRSLGLGKAVLVSEVGSFPEFPDDVCLKVPVGAGEEDLIFEYLNLLVSRPDVAQALGERARRLRGARVQLGDGGAAVRGLSGARWWTGTGVPAAATTDATPPRPPAASPGRQPKPRPLAPAICDGWAVNDDSRADYLETHQTRLVKTLEITPPGGPGDRILEMGAYLQITPALRTKLGYGEVRGCYYGQLGRVDHRAVTSADGRDVRLRHRSFRRREGPLPLSRRALLHGALLRADRASVRRSHAPDVRGQPHSEARRPPGADHARTSPRCAASRPSCRATIRDSSTPTSSPAESGEVDARHNREYTPREIHQLLENSGFEVARLETGEFRDVPHPEFGWVLHLLERYRLETDLRGDGIYALGRKTGRGARALPRVAVLMSAAYLDPRSHSSTRPRARCARSSRVRNDRPRPWRASGGLRHRLSPVRRGDRHADRGRPARPLRSATCSPANRCRWRSISRCRRKTAATRCVVSPMREDVCWYYEKGWPLPAGGGGDARTVRRSSARVRVADHAPRCGASANCAAVGRALVVPAADHLAQPQADPRDGAARHSGPLPRLASAARSGPSSIRCC